MDEGKKLVGRPGKRRDQGSKPVVTNWQTDIIDNRDPDFAYQFFREDEVRDKLRPTRVAVTDFETGETEVHDIPGWQVCQRDTGPEALAGFRPDEGKPLDTVLRHGSHVAMKLPRAAWEILQRVQEQRADAYETRLKGGHREEYDLDGNQTRMAAGQQAAVRVIEKPLQRI